VTAGGWWAGFGRRRTSSSAARVCPKTGWGPITTTWFAFVRAAKRRPLRRGLNLGPRLPDDEDRAQSTMGHGTGDAAQVDLIDR
jgi:hypothetical protein